jgi:hypothetical protein
MSEEPMDEIEVKPLHFTQHTALTVDEWPEHIEVTDEWLKQAYLSGAVVDGDTLRFALGNGEAEYHVDRSKKHGHGFVASLVEGNDKANLKSRKRKFETGASD